MNTLKQKEILEALSRRYATKQYDPTKKVNDEDLHTILETGRLSPSSLGLEAWKFIVISNPEIREKMRAASYNQPQVTDASHIIVIARRTDDNNLSPELIQRTSEAQGKSEEELEELKQMTGGTISSKEVGVVRDAWLAAQTYIPLGMMMETAALLGIDSTPMEGFDAQALNRTLELASRHLSAVTMLAVGYRGKDPYAKVPKTRRSFDEVVEFIK